LKNGTGKAKKRNEQKTGRRMQGKLSQDEKPTRTCVIRGETEKQVS